MQKKPQPQQIVRKTTTTVVEYPEGLVPVVMDDGEEYDAEVDEEQFEEQVPSRRKPRR